MEITIRECKKEDLPEALALIKELANYENALEEVDLTLEQLEKDGFGKQPLFGMYIAVESNRVVGIALFTSGTLPGKEKPFFLKTSW